MNLNVDQGIKIPRLQLEYCLFSSNYNCNHGQINDHDHGGCIPAITWRALKRHVTNVYNTVQCFLTEFSELSLIFTF